MEEELRLCANCEKKVPSTYFHLHEAHCLRFRTICPECKEVILKKELKDHQENGHKQAQCNLCGKTMKQYLLEAHEAVCPEHPIRCEFCDLAVPLSHLEEHETSCGAQTVTRINCKQPVLQAQRASPEDLGRSGTEKPKAKALEKSGLSAPRKRGSCPECGQDIAEAKISQHQEECRQFTGLARSFDACQLKRSDQAAPAWRDPSRQDPSQRDPSQWDPSRRDPSRRDPSQRDPSQRDPSRWDPSWRDPSRRHPSRQDPSRRDPSRRDPSQRDPSRRDPSRRDPSQAFVGLKIVRKKNQQEDHGLQIFPNFQITRSQPLRSQEEEYDVLEGCSRCHILLPLPVLRQHKEKCQCLTMEQLKILKQRIPDGSGKSQTGSQEVLWRP